MSLQKSKGHICFEITTEVIEIKGFVYRALKDNRLDPEGYKYGAVPISGWTAEDFKKDLEDFKLKYPEIWAKNN